MESLLFVCGPSSVGKSSFIRQLASGVLPAEVKSRLPPGVEGWERVEPKHFVAVAAEADRPKVMKGLVFHYDTMRIYTRGWLSYNEDRALDIFASSKRTLIVDLRTRSSALEQHWLSRLSRQRPQGWFRRTSKAIKRAARRKVYVPEAVVRAEGFSILDSYRDVRWIDEAYSRWDAFLDQITNLEENVDIIHLESVFRMNAEPIFRIRSSPASGRDNSPRL